MTDEIVKVEFAPQFQPAEITADFDSMKAELAKLLEPYQGMTDEALMKMDTREVKSCRADVNRIIKSVEDGRKAIKRAYNEPLAAFEEQVKELLLPAHEAADMLGGVVNRKEMHEQKLRLEGLKNTYLDAAGVLVDVVPFERLLELNPHWKNKGRGAAKHAEELVEIHIKLNKDWKRLQSLEESMPFYQEAEAEFFRTLDIGAAIDFDKKRQEEQAKIDALKADVEEIKEYQQQVVEKPAETAPYEEQEDEVMEFVFTVFCTTKERDEIIAYLKSKGIQGKAGKVA